MISITIEAPQPLLPAGKFIAEDTKPLWRIKKFALSRCCQGVRYPTPSLKKKGDELAAIYEDWNVSEKIPIKSISTIEDKRFKERLVYESYKPANLRQMQDFMHFVLLFRSTLPNASLQRQLFTTASMDLAEAEKTPSPTHGSNTVEDIMHNPEVSQEIKNYYNAEAQTKLPDQLGMHVLRQIAVDQQKILVFDSNFESGNLDRVGIVSLYEYNLFLNPDTNTKGHSQWFYFAVTNTEKGRKVVFNILNCTKPVGLFKDGMKPLVYSELEHELNGAEWLPSTANISYYRNEIPKNPPRPSTSAEGDSQPPTTYYYTLSFSYTFQHTSDRVYFAYSRPYSVGMCYSLLRSIKQTLLTKARNVTVLEEDGLQKRVKQFVKEETEDEKKKAQGEEDQLRQRGRRHGPPHPQPEPSFVTADVLRQYKEAEREAKFCWTKGNDFQIETEQFIYRQETLCHTFCGFPIQLLTITAHSTKKHPLGKRKIVFITARVHAAEVTGSFKVEGILNFLTSDDPLAERLREIYVFKIVPMLNPEGVISGNFRCSITGTDLNRRWDQPDEILHPQIFYLKNLMKKLVSEKKEILVFCDLHGHSRKNNAFIYGCNKAANGGFCSWTKVRLLPRIIATKTPLFSYQDCRFRVECAKQRTARVVVWREFGVTNSFTLESSFYGYRRGEDIAPYGVEEYYELGLGVLKGLLEYHYVLKNLEKELVETRGWLKPSRLLAVTGVLAADVLARKIAQEKEEARRKRRAQEMELTIKRRKEKASICCVVDNCPLEARQKLPPGSPSNKSKSQPKTRKKASEHAAAKHTPKKNLPVLRSPIQRRGESNKTSQYKIANTSQIESNPYLPLIQTKSSQAQSAYDSPDDRRTVGDVSEGPGESVSGTELALPTAPLIEVKERAVEDSGVVQDKGKRRYTQESEDTAERAEEWPEPAGTNVGAKEEEENDPDLEFCKKEWRSYFTREEITTAYQELNAGIDPNEKEAEEKEEEGSDSNPSEDNLEADEMQDFIASLPASKQQQQLMLQRSVSEHESKPKVPTDKTARSTRGKINVDSPSMIITSKNKTKGIALVVKEPVRPKAKYYTTMYGPEPQESDSPSVGAKRQTSFEKNLPRIPKSNRRVLSMAQDGSVTVQVLRKEPSSSRNQKREIALSVPPDKLLPSLVPSLTMGKDVSPASKESASEAEFGPHSTEPVKNSANIRMTMPPGAGSATPMININIKNVNINSPVFGGQYDSLGSNAWEQSTRFPWNVGSVISSIPRHDRSPAFQKLFGQPPRPQQVERQTEYYSNKKRRKIGTTLAELMVGGYIPLNVKDYVIGYTKRAGAGAGIGAGETTLNPPQGSTRAFRPRGKY